MKRILTLDGGGIRGLFSLQILKRIEQEFREEYKKPDLVLRDVFDFFAGTSTGAIIATYLAWGKSVQDIEDLYINHAERMFSPMPWYLGWKSKFRAEEITDFFREQFCEEDGTPAKLNTKKLWSEKAQKYLLIVMRNATDGASWPVSNNPRAVESKILKDPAGVLNLPLWQLLRASTAAPTFFPPEEITLNNLPYVFMDGGITPYNNPSLIAVFMATMPPFFINWPTGPDNIHVVSVGTGHARVCLPPKKAKRIYWVTQAKYVIPALMHTVAKEQDKVCRVLGHCVYDGKEINADKKTEDWAGDLDKKTSLLTPSEKKFTYVRYNHEFTDDEEKEAKRIINEHRSWATWMREIVLKNTSKQTLTLDKLELKEFFRETGRAYAAKAVKREHLFPPKANPDRTKIGG